MNELDMLKIINDKLSVKEFLGNDCAELMNFDSSQSIYITHDTLVEDVHFSRETISDYQLGVKAVSVNISDLCAALALPKYISISLSMPADISSDFVSEFYRGINDACERFGCYVCGGDLTRSEKIVVSICAIGQQECSTYAGRNRAEKGDAVVLFGQAGGSALGLYELEQNKHARTLFTEAHLNPKTSYDAVLSLSLLNLQTIGTMDTSDGLADAIYKISQASCKILQINGDKIPVISGFEERCQHFGLNSQDMKLFGAEDFCLLATIPQKYLNELKALDYAVIGKVGEISENPVSIVKFDGKECVLLTEALIKEKTFKHFTDEITGGENAG